MNSSGAVALDRPAPPVTTRLRLAVAGGGTGGHIVPGLHLLEHLGAAGIELSHLLWFHAGRPIEEEVLDRLSERTDRAPLERVVLPVEPPGGGAPGLPRLAVRLPRSVLRARAALRAADAQVLLGLGGYTTAPAVLAARSLGVPVVLLEINARAGRATRVLGPLAQRVLHAWSATLPRSEDSRHRLVGPPVGRAFRPAEEGEVVAARAELGLDPERPLVVVLGGSQGAGALNTFVREHRARLLDAGLAILHQVGPGRRDEAGPAIPGCQVVEYLRDVPRALRAATVVLCRGGASTLAELAVSGSPAWVVPYPHHSDRHQEHNARQFGEGVRIVDESLLGAPIVRQLVELVGPAGAERRGRMREALLEAVPGDGAARILAELRAVAGEK